MNARTAAGSDTMVLKSHPSITGAQTFLADHYESLNVIHGDVILVVIAVIAELSYQRRRVNDGGVRKSIQRGISGSEAD